MNFKNLILVTDPSSISDKDITITLTNKTYIIPDKYFDNLINTVCNISDKCGKHFPKY